MSALEVSNSTVQQLFSTAGYQFTIPDYQRPYSWTADEVASLLDDISSAFPYGESSDANDNYFLGSVVLIKQQGNPKSDVVDGQQRITTLTLIFSVISFLLPNGQQIRSDLIEKQDFLGNKTPNLRLQSSDDDFFEKWIREPSDLIEISKLDVSGRSESQQRIIENVKYLVESKLHCPSSVELSHWLSHLLIKITQNCYLITISTSDFNSAYRIFSTINSRGLNLKPNDVLKAEIIGNIEPEKRSKYTQIWNAEEEDLGRDDFERLFYTIRGFVLNRRKYNDLLTSYRKEILPKYEASDFIDSILKPSSDTFEQIKFSKFVCDDSEHQTKIRELCLWLNELSNNDWMPPAIYFVVKYPNDSELILRFFTKLERLAAGLMILRVRRGKERENIFHALIDSINEGAEEAIQQAHNSLKSSQRKKILNALDGKIYEGKGKAFRTYILLRLDSALADGGKSPSLEQKPTIEHILPQNPSVDSQWLKDWQDANERKNWVHRLGNLAFLSGKANAKAKNYDFTEKKEKYFMSNLGAPVYPITTRVLNQSIWTPEVVTKFQKQYVSTLKELWELD